MYKFIYNFKELYTSKDNYFYKRRIIVLIMKVYLDKNKEEIKKGFYKHEEYNALFYFTGKYDIEEFPIFKIEGDSKKRYSLYPNLVQQLSKINNDKLNEEIKKSKLIVSEIEKILEK